MADTYPSILHIENAALTNLGNLQIGVMAGDDADLGYRPWGGVDGAGDLTLWLAKDEVARVQSLYVLDLDVLSSSGVVVYDSDGLLAGEGALNDLDDVTITTPAANEILVYDGAGWVNSGAGVVGPSSSTDDAIVTWDGTTGALVQNTVARFQNIADHHIFQVLDTAADTTWIDLIQVEAIPANGLPGGQTVVVGDADNELLLRVDGDPYIYNGSAYGKIIHEKIVSGWTIESRGDIESSGADTLPPFGISTTGTNAGNTSWYVGDRDPLNNVTATPGSVYYRSDGTSSGVHVHKGAASNNTGWIELAEVGAFGTLDDGYNYDSGERTITVDDGAVNWNITGDHDFGITLTSLTPTGSIGFKVIDGSYTFDVVKSTSYTYLDASLGEFNLVGEAESQLVVSGASEDLIFGARGETINLNDADNTTLEGGFTETSILGAINEARYPAGINWVSRTNPSDLSFAGVCYGGGMFVAVAGTGEVMSSPDAINWTMRTAAAALAWSGICYGNSLFVAVAGSGTGNRVMTSPDGITWTSRTSAQDDYWRAVTFGGGLFVAVSSNGTVMSSPDGVTWTLRTAASANQWRSVCFGNSLFVAASTTGTGDRIMTSPDGITWTSRTSAQDNDWRGLCYGAEGLYVAVASSGTGNRIMTSPDGITWTSRTISDSNWYAICYGQGVVVAVGTSGAVATSYDGVTWSGRTAASTNNWLSVCYGDKAFVAIATTGTGDRVMTSGSVDTIMN